MLILTWAQEEEKDLSWKWNPFYGITKDYLVNSSLVTRFLDTYSIFSGKKTPKEVGLLEYLLLPLDIIEALLAVTIIGAALAFLLALLHVLLESVIAVVLTLALTPVILATHGICQVIKFFNPPIRQDRQDKSSENRAENEDVPPPNQNPTVTKEPVENDSGSKNESSPVSQPQPKIPAQTPSEFIWEDHPLGGKYTVVKSTENDQLFFWINSSSTLFMSTNKEAVNNLFSASLWGDSIGSNYTTQVFDQNFPEIAEKNYSDYKPTKYEENSQESSNQNQNKI